MAHLGVPTTRAATVVTSNTHVLRDNFYNGNPVKVLFRLFLSLFLSFLLSPIFPSPTWQERCTVILRIAETFLRFGSFEIVKETDTQTGKPLDKQGRKREREMQSTAHTSKHTTHTYTHLYHRKSRSVGRE